MPCLENSVLEVLNSTHVKVPSAKIQGCTPTSCIGPGHSELYQTRYKTPSPYSGDTSLLATQVLMDPSCAHSRAPEPSIREWTALPIGSGDFNLCPSLSKDLVPWFGGVLWLAMWVSEEESSIQLSVTVQSIGKEPVQPHRPQRKMTKQMSKVQSSVNNPRMP